MPVYMHPEFNRTIVHYNAGIVIANIHVISISILALSLFSLFPCFLVPFVSPEIFTREYIFFFLYLSNCLFFYHPFLFCFVVLPLHIVRTSLHSVLSFPRIAQNEFPAFRIEVLLLTTLTP